ncbi:tyrosine-type recombinase/integrase [Pseudomonas juntendi]|uniref:tyrosine-type recombinase/integrase n=1 Tax=Pseudomonas juntendi TaxID=2666183 RepID=UPI0015FB71DA|nr:site-specific integrase [Pseudomonas juntendi]MBA6125294.1 site-specific integrase [Pseudomonas juntendi]
MSTSKTLKQIEVRDTLVEALIIISYPATGNSTYYVREPTKSRRRIKLGASKDLTLKQARKKAVEVLNADYHPAPPTLLQVFEAYAKSGEYSGKRSLTQERKRFERVVEPILGSKSITAIDVTDVQAVMAALNSSLSDATRNRYLAMLRSIFRFSVAHGFSDKDPSRSIKLRREVPVKLYEVTDDFIGRLRSAARWLQKREPSTAALVELLLLTGMRIGEALPLQWSDVNFSTRQITLRRTKSGKVRHVPISDDCLALLIRRVEMTADSAWDWLFPSSRGHSHMTRPVRPWKKACKAVGLPPSLRFHDLRHIYASACVKEGIPLYTVQGLLGHSSIQMTERYSSLASEDLLKASCRVSSTLGFGMEAAH